MVTELVNQLTDMSDSRLLWQIAQEYKLIASTQELVQRLEYEVIQRAQGRGAKAIITEQYTADLVASVSYDQSRFTPLLEALPEEGVKDAYAPEHTETITIPAKWHTQKAIKWANKVGGAALNIIAEARMEGAPKVKLTEKVAANVAR